MIPTRHPSWKEFAAKVGGEFRANRFWRSDEVVTQLGDWEVHLDTVMLDPETGAPHTDLRTGAPAPGLHFSTRRGTQVWANFTSIDGFRFVIRDRQALHRNPWGLQWDIDVGRLIDKAKSRLGVEDVEVGHPDFDDRFTVRTNDPAKLRNLFDSSILEQVMRCPDLAEIRIDSEPVDGAVPRAATMLIWRRLMTHDVEELVDFHELILGLLDRLANQGSAAPFIQPPSN
jgi:hypothetical protein